MSLSIQNKKKWINEKWKPKKMLKIRFNYKIKIVSLQQLPKKMDTCLLSLIIIELSPTYAQLFLYFYNK